MSTAATSSGLVAIGAVFVSYASQDAEAARRICEALRAAGVETRPPEAGPITQGNVRRQCFRVYLLAASGQRDEAEELGRQILTALPGLARKGQRGFYGDDALVHLARGDRARALAALLELSKIGGCSTDFGAGAPYQVLRDEPEFQALMETNATRVAEQRAKIDRSEAAGELAPIPPLPHNPR